MYWISKRWTWSTPWLQRNREYNNDNLETDVTHQGKNISGHFPFNATPWLFWVADLKGGIACVANYYLPFFFFLKCILVIAIDIITTIYKYNLTSVVLHADNFAGWFVVKVIGISFTSTIDKNHAFPLFFIVIPTTICSSAWAFKGW